MARPHDKLLGAISLSRIAIASIIIVIFDKDSVAFSWTCVALYVLGHLTDHADGYIARNYSTPTDAGFMVDSVSDKLFQIGGLIPIHLYFGLSIMLLWIVLVREFFVVGLFSFIDISDAKIVWYISRYTYVFAGAIRATTLCYFFVPIVSKTEPSLASYLMQAGFAGYVVAIAASLVTIVHMYKASRTMKVRKLIDGADN
jgi:phosphatidylglycerophosphate synthase